jgi:hypothetical protein
MTKKIVLMLAAVIVCEIIILLLSMRISDLATIKYQLAARYSARTSFIIISGILLLIGIKGLKQIYDHENLRQLFMMLLLAFAINHLIHFIFIVLNYNANNMQLFHLDNGFGAVGYVMLSLAPLYLWSKKKLTRSLHLQINAFLFIVISIFFILYLGKLNTVATLGSPLLLYGICLLVIVFITGINIYRFVQDRKKLS